ncbi:LysE family translocator [Jannaschia marina]|uniref:LysE family translocator n=1 Tax=Jannaschia marina TaxID=2741674 RepID=UPI0015CBD9A9|nr:LysE family translocator [Jannaschia marina]
MLEAYLIVLVGVAAAQASPGPNLVAVASAALGRGRAAGLWVTAGVASGMLVWAVAVAFGLGALFTAFPATLVALKLIGGAYLLYLSQKGLRAALRGGTPAIRTDGGASSARRNWGRGLIVVLTNPKAALMWASVAVVLFGAGLSTAEVALFGPVGATSGFLIYGSYALLFSTRAVGSLYRRFTRAVEALFGLAFGTFGAKLVVDGVRDLRP